MIKPDSLRAFLTAAVPDLKAEPERLQIFIDKGRISATGTPGLGCLYAYTLSLLLTDFAGSPDAVFLPILAWLGRHQRDLLQAYERNGQAIVFEADILEHGKVDLSIELQLTETVTATARAGGGYDVVHHPEPPLDPGFGPWADTDDDATPANLRELYFAGELIAQWTPP